jgi:hypothetical protein
MHTEKPLPDVATDAVDASTNASDLPTPVAAQNLEIGGRAGPDPTRYGDWEKNGRCIDF